MNRFQHEPRAPCFFKFMLKILQERSERDAAWNFEIICDQ